jgi:hypothetical protein
LKGALHWRCSMRPHQLWRNGCKDPLAFYILILW